MQLTKEYLKEYLDKKIATQQRFYEKSQRSVIKEIKVEFQRQTDDIKVEFQKQTKALAEHFDTKVQVIAEQYGTITDDISDIKRELVRIKDRLEAVEVRTVMMKQDLIGIKTELEVIKDMLTDKVDVEAHQVLTQRVYALEHRGVA